MDITEHQGQGVRSEDGEANLGNGEEIDEVPRQGHEYSPVA